MSRKKADASLIAEAAEWRLIGLLLERPRRGWHAEVATLSREVRDQGLRAAATAARGASEGDYFRLLGPGGLVSPRAVTYQPFADPGQLLADLATVYDAFAFRPHVEEPIDHIAVAVAFVGYLLLKEAYAVVCCDRTAAATVAGARRDFLEIHLATFAGAFAQRLENAGASYLQALARLLAARFPARHAAQPLPGTESGDVCGACDFSETY